MILTLRYFAFEGCYVLQVRFFQNNTGRLCFCNFLGICKHAFYFFFPAAFPYQVYWTYAVLRKDVALWNCAGVQVLFPYFCLITFHHFCQ